MFKNKIIWITGASSGIGKAVALKFAKLGAKLVLSSRRRVVLEEVKLACISHGCTDQDIMVLPLDMLEESSFNEAVMAVTDHFGRVDMLFNNAGISQRSLCLDTEMSVYRTLFEVDVFSQIALTKLVLPLMLAKGEGHLVVTASLAGKIGVPYRTGYCSAKHAIIGFFDALRAELANTAIKVTTITPGFISTELSKNALCGDGTEFGKTDADIANGIAVDVCAEKIIQGLSQGQQEIVIAGIKERSALLIKRFFPKLLFRIIAKIVTKPSATSA